MPISSSSSSYSPSPPPSPHPPLPLRAPAFPLRSLDSLLRNRNMVLLLLMIFLHIHVILLILVIPSCYHVVYFVDIFFIGPSAKNLFKIEARCLQNIKLWPVTGFNIRAYS